MSKDPYRTKSVRFIYPAVQQCQDSICARLPGNGFGGPSTTRRRSKCSPAVLTALGLSPTEAIRLFHRPLTIRNEDKRTFVDFLVDRFGAGQAW